MKLDKIFLAVSLLLAGCKSTPEKTAAPAEAPGKSSFVDVKEDAPEPLVSATVQKAGATAAPAAPEAMMKIADYCEKSLAKFPGKSDAKALHEACQTVEIFPECVSQEGEPIFHYNRKGQTNKAQNVLVFSLIHGDETPAGSVGRFWMERLQTIEPRNNWRVVPILNPDGVKRKTRTNANKVDVNRNFPTRDWEEKAKPYWQRDTKSNPRRFPGDVAASEPETKCALKHLEDFNPDFVVSIHTPLKVLDFDGPKVKTPKYDYLPWKSLGHYPGSLGRYMWFERNVPVLTMELKEDLPDSTEPLVELQDIIGVLVGLELESSNKVPSKTDTKKK